jgi:hypothetical protein
MMVEL